jgi:hypothetical protein
VQALSHEYPVEFGPYPGIHDLTRGCVAMAAAPERLEVTLSPGSEGEAAALRRLVRDHPNRFAFRVAPLAFVWAAQEEASQ